VWPASTTAPVRVIRLRSSKRCWPGPAQDAFTADLQALLAPITEVDVVQETFLAMAPTAL
jgi:hypothetical protein